MKSKVLNNGAHWDSNSRATLKDLVARGVPTKIIAKMMGRTPNSITFQKGVMKLYSPNGPKCKSNLKNAVSRFNKVIDMLNGDKENKESFPKMSRTEWNKENLATLKRLGDTNHLYEAPKVLGCTENAARIKYGRVFKRGVVVKPVAEVIKTSVNPAASVTREQAKDMSRAAREIARANGKRITMAMFFVEEL